MDLNHKLSLLRHAKSEHAYGIQDHDRPISERGVSDCKLMASWLKANIEKPELILCSTSKRTRMTLQNILKLTEWDSSIQYQEELYLPTKGEVYAVLASQNNKIKSILIIGHNPGFTNVYNTLSYNTLDNLPTCGFAQFDITEPWNKLAFKKFTNTAFQIPKKLR